MADTPRGFITYPSEGDTDWYSTAENGLEAWLLRAELLGIPTYDTFSDLPTAGSTEVVNPGTGKTQRQFAAVAADATIYRDNGSSWVAWANYYTDTDAVSAINSDADHGSTASHNYFSGSHNDLSNVGSSDHHAKYTDSEAQTAINNDSDHGSTASHNYFSGSHTDLSNVGSSDHHTKYTDENAQDAIGAIVSTQFTYDDANNILNIDPHAGLADAHHAKYTDSEAISAINNDADHGSTASHNYFSGSHNDLTNVGSSDHHAKYTDSDAQTAINNDADHGSTASHNYFSGSHNDLSNVGASDHHSKTTSLADITDVDASEIRTGTLANQPAAGTSGRWYLTTDNNGIYYDNGTSWLLIAEHPGNISASELGFDPATQTELDNHAGSSSAHHAKYTDSDAQTAINNDADHGSTASHNYFSGSHNDLSNVGSSDHHSRYSDEEAEDAIGAIVSTQFTYDDANNSLNIDPHETTSNAHHAKYTDSEAQSAINNDTDHGSTAPHNYFSGSHTDLSNVGSSDHHAKYTDSEAVSALESATAPVLTGEWRFEDEVSIRGTSASEDSGDAVLNLRPNPDDSSLDGLVKFLASDNGQRAAWMYDQDNEQVRLWNYLNGGNKIVAPLSAGPVNFPPGAESGGNPIPYSSSGTEYDIQKNGTDGAGTINLDANNGQLTADGDTVAGLGGPENRELMGQASDTDTSTNLDMTISHASGYEEVQFSVEVQGAASSTTYSVFIQLNGDTGSNYEYNQIRNETLSQVTGSNRFRFQVWGSNTERNRFSVDGGSSQNFIRQLTGSADNRYTIISGDQTSSASDGPITEVQVSANFNAAGSMYAIGVPGP